MKEKIEMKNTKLSMIHERTSSVISFPIDDYFKDFPVDNYELNTISTRKEEFIDFITKFEKYFSHPNRLGIDFQSGFFYIPISILIEQE